MKEKTAKFKLHFVHNSASTKASISCNNWLSLQLSMRKKSIISIYSNIMHWTSLIPQDSYHINYSIYAHLLTHSGRTFCVTLSLHFCIGDYLYYFSTYSPNIKNANRWSFQEIAKDIDEESRRIQCSHWHWPFVWSILFTKLLRSFNLIFELCYICCYLWSCKL